MSASLRKRLNCCVAAKCDYFDRDLPRLMLVGTGLTSLLAAVGAYLLLVHWPSPAEKQ
jgi:hypothetical protein